MRKNWKKNAACLLLISMALFYSQAVFADIGNETVVQDEENTFGVEVQSTQESTPIVVSHSQSPTIDEIKAYYAENPFDMNQATIWVRHGDPVEGTVGRLCPRCTENAMKVFNFIRYVAGLNEVTYSDELESYAMAGTALLNKMGRLEHTPQKPSWASDAYYEIAYKGTSSSNLGMGYRTLPEAIVKGWMEDGDASNIDRVGHRRWILNPTMGKTAFGHTGNITAMYAFDRSSDAVVSQKFIPWPAVNMPLEVFHGPWSISLDRNEFNTSNPADIRVSLTNLLTNQEYVLTSVDKNPSGRYLNVDNGGFGFGPAIIFSPNVNFKEGDRVRVKVNGLLTNSGEEADISYEVNFFKMGWSGGSSASNPVVDITKEIVRDDTKQDGSISKNDSTSKNDSASKGSSTYKGSASTGSSSTGASRGGGSSSGGGGGSSSIVSTTKNNTNQSGKWQKEADNSWSYIRNGSAVKSDWILENKQWFRTNEMGRVFENAWIFVNGKWFYAKSGGYIAQNEWFLYQGKYYYLEDGGYMAADKWVNTGGNWYYCDASGVWIEGKTR